VGPHERTAALHFEVNGRLYSAAPSAFSSVAYRYWMRLNDVGGRTATTGNFHARSKGVPPLLASKQRFGSPVLESNCFISDVWARVREPPRWSSTASCAS
jgi:hypothetical protein